MSQQIILIATAGEGSVSAWYAYVRLVLLVSELWWLYDLGLADRNLNSGSYIFGFKENRCSTNSLTLVGRDHLAAAQANRAAVYFWTWHKVHSGTCISKMFAFFVCCVNEGGMRAVARAPAISIPASSETAGHMSSTISDHSFKMECLWRGTTCY